MAYRGSYTEPKSSVAFKMSLISHLFHLFAHRYQILLETNYYLKNKTFVRNLATSIEYDAWVDAPVVHRFDQAS